MVRMNSAHGVPDDLNLLLALDVLLREQSVTRAARVLGVTQSAVSHKLRRLREHFADPLFVSTRAGLVPTARAAALSLPLRHALRDLEAAVAAGEPFRPKTSDRCFVVATSDYGEFVVLPDVLDVLRTQAPFVRALLEPPSADVPPRLEAGRVDLHVGPPLAAPTTLKRKKLATESFVLLAREGHPKLGRRPTLAGYLELDHLVVASGARDESPVDEWLAARGRRRRIALRTASFASAPFLVARSDLVMTAPSALAEVAARYARLERLPLPFPSPEVALFMTWHDRARGDAGHAWLRRIVEHVTRKATFQASPR